MDKFNTKTTSNNELISDKSKTIALLLCYFFGGIGLHYFYVGRVGRGILYVCTLGILGIGYFVDIVKICNNKFKDKNGAVLRKWGLD